MAEVPGVADRATGLQRLSAWERLRGVDPKMIILSVAIIILLWQVAVPIFMIVYGSFKEMSPGRPGFWSLSFTLDNFVRGYTHPIFPIAARNTFVAATGAAAMAWTMALFLAWIVERTNTPFRKLIFTLSIARMILPGILTTIGWIMLMSPNIGWLNVLWRTLPFTDGPLFNIYTLWGVIWVMGVDMIPTSFLLMWAALRSIDPSMEEAASTSGSSPLRTLQRVTVPLIRPAAIAVFLLAWVRGIENFEVPALVGYPRGIDFFSTQIYYNTQTSPVDYGMVGAYAMAMLAVSVLAIVAYVRATRIGKRFMTITGKGYRPRRIDLGRWRYATAGFALTLLVTTIGLPLSVLLYESFLSYLTPFSWDAFGKMNLEQYRIVWFGYGNTLLAFWNSFIMSTVSATFIVVLVSLIAWIAVKTNVRGRSIADGLAFAPMAVPGLILGLSFLWLYLSVPWGGAVLGSIWIITLAMVTTWMPFSMRVISANMSQIHSELEEASYVSGVGWFGTFKNILIPLLAPGMLAAWVWVVVHAFRDVTTSLMLFSQSNQTVGVQIFLLFERGTYNTVSALGVILVFVLLLLVIGLQQISKRVGVRQSL